MAEPSAEKDQAEEAARAARIEGARSDFVSSLNRRVQELRACLAGLEQDRGSPRLRDDLRRRVHALTAGARLLRFGSMATALADVERLLERAAAVGELEPAELRTIADVLDGLHALAWNEPTQEQRPTERPPIAPTLGESAVVAPTVLVVGSSGIADAITLPIEQAAENDIECERTDTPGTALDLARALAPDVAVVDTDLPGAKELIEKLARDPLTEPMPIIVVGTWSSPEEGATWLANGVARALAKPVSPYELRNACVELSAGRDESHQHRPLGETTVDELTNRIVAEIRRGISDALVVGKGTPVALGDGSDILAAVWGAVARVRDLVTIKSGGGVRFSARGPEGALPFAPWWGDNGAPDRRAPPRIGSDPPRKTDNEPRLAGRRIVVADDDPAVTWFIGGVLKAAGADVREAHDGDRALELCFRLSPELVISDVLMPGLDGFALCRALKRDIALRDVPVILLSWKEDLLQRLRDLGADADGYMRKEASATALLRRVQDVLRPRARIEARLAESGEVRGRLDGVTPRTLLHITSRARPDARIGIRDASFLYELELRAGCPKSATRTTSDGSFQRGKEVFAALLGVRAGRFVVTHADKPVRGTLEGDLEGQLEAPLAHARAALKLLGGTRLLEVHRVHVALDRVLAYLSATPEPARTLVNRIAHGASPRALILASEVAPAQLEAVLADLATHGAIVGIQGASGADLLHAALDHELVTIRRGGTPSMPPPEQAPLPDRPTLSSEGREAPPVRVMLDSDPAPSSGSGRVVVGQGVAVAEMVRVEKQPETADPPPVGNESIAVRWESTPEIDVEHMPPPQANWKEASDEHTPSSLEAAVIREISDRTPLPAPLPRQPPPSAEQASIVDMSELKARPPNAQPASAPQLPSLPPDAMVPDSPSEERLSAAQAAPTAAAATTATNEKAEAPSPEAAKIAPPLETSARSDAHPGAVALELAREAARAREQAAAVAESSGRVAAPVPRGPSSGQGPASGASRLELEGSRRPPVVSARPVAETTDDSIKPPSGGGSFGVGIIVAIAAMAALALGLRYGRAKLGEAAPPPVDPQVTVETPFPELPPSPTATAAAEPSVTAGEALSAEAAPSGSPVARPFGGVPTISADGGLLTPAGSATTTTGEDLPLPPGVVVTLTQGLLDVETPGKESIFVDGVELGRGPNMRLVLSVGVHEVRQRVRGEWRIRFVLIRPSRRTRLPLSGWTR